MDFISFGADDAILITGRQSDAKGICQASERVIELHGFGESATVDLIRSAVAALFWRIWLIVQNLAECPVATNGAGAATLNLPPPSRLRDVWKNDVSNDFGLDDEAAT